MSVSVFDVFHKVLLEKNYSYLIPQDKELLLYDFYMLVHLNALDKEGRFEPGDKKDPYGQVAATSTRSMGLSDSTKFSFEEIKKQVIDYLQPELLEAALFSISCEIRHTFDMNSIPDIPKKIQDPQDFFRHFKYNYEKLKSMKSVKSNIGGINDIFAKRRREFNKKYDIKIKKNTANRNNDYQMSYKAVKRTLKSINMSEIDFVRLAGNAFLKLSWAGSYGGKPWASICDAFQKLYYAKREVDKIIYIDNMYHQQHNTDTVFNKLGQYYKNGYHWVLNALNFKADVKDNWDRIERIRKVTGNKMRNIDKMYIEMLKASGDKTWQQYYKIENKTDEQKKLEDEWLDDLGSSNGGSSAIPSKLQQKYYNLAKGELYFKDKESNKKRELPPETIEYYKKLAKEGKKKFNDSHVTNMNVVYIGHGTNVETAIKHGILPYDTEDNKKSYGKWLTVGKWEHLTSLSDISFAYDVWMLNYQWTALFGPISALNSESKEVPAIARAKFRKIAKEYLEAGKFYHNDKKQRLIPLGDGSTINADADITALLTPENIYGNHKTDDMDNEIYLMNGLEGNHKDLNYFTTEDKWEELFGPLPVIIPNADMVPADVKRAFIKLAQNYKGNQFLDSWNDERLIYIGTGQDLHEGITGTYQLPIKLTSDFLYGAQNTNSSVIHLSPGMTGSNFNMSYFIPEKKWIKLFGPPPKVYNNTPSSTTTKTKPELSPEIKQMLIDWAMQGYKIPQWEKWITDGGFIYVGTGPIFGNTNPDNYVRTEDIYYKAPSGELVSGATGKISWVDYFLKKEKWVEIMGQQPPPNLTF